MILVEIKELEIQQGILAELYVNANIIMQLIDKAYTEKKSNKRRRPTTSDEIVDDETTIQPKKGVDYK